MSHPFNAAGFPSVPTTAPDGVALYANIGEPAPEPHQQQQQQHPGSQQQQQQQQQQSLESQQQQPDPNRGILPNGELSEFFLRTYLYPLRPRGSAHLRRHARRAGSCDGVPTLVGAPTAPVVYWLC